MTVSDFDFGFDEFLNPIEKEAIIEGDVVNSPIEKLEDLSVEVPAQIADPREKALEDLMKSIENLSGQIQTYEQDHMNPIRDAIAAVTNERNDAQKVYTELMKMLAEKEYEHQQKLRDAKQEKYKLDDELMRLQREHANMLKSIAAEKLLKEIEEKIDHLIMDSPMGMAARKYQLLDLKYTVAAFESGKSGVLNANDMGLGKTFETIFVLHCLKHLFQEKYGYAPSILWLTAPSLIRQTVKEFKKWAPNLMVIPCEGSWNKDAREFATRMAIEQNAVLVANYQQMNTNMVLFNTTYDIIVNDEVSMLKGGAQAKPTLMWQNMKQMIWECEKDRRGNVNFKDPYNPKQKCKFYLPLSGTPIQNKPSDMWAYLHIFAPTRFPNLTRFENEYCYGWGKQKKLLPSEVERIINIMDGQVIRRSKKDELDLPEKNYIQHEVPMTEKQRELYEQMKANFFIWIDNKKEEAIQARVVIAWIIRLWQIALFPGMMKIFDANMNEIPVDCNESGILDAAMQMIEDNVNAGEKVVVWSSWFNGALDELHKRLAALDIKSFVYSGDKSTEQRQYAVDSFKSDDEDSVQVMLMNMKAGGMGVDGLQRSSTCIMLDQWWNYATNEQAIDRQHRIGQEGSLMIHQLQAENSVYAFVKAKADAKQEMAESIMESRELRKGEDWITFLEGMI